MSPTTDRTKRNSLVLQSHILVEKSESTLVVAVAGPGLVAPPPTGPGQHSLR